MSWTTFFQKLKVTQNGHFSSKSESWCSPLCSKLAHWWVGPLFFKSWKLIKMAIFHQKVSHDAHLFAPNWLTDELDHFFQKLKVTQNGHFSSKSESWCSPLCSKLAHWWVGPLFFKSWKSLKMAIFHQKVSHDAHLFAPNWLTDELDHFFSKVESHSKWPFFIKKWVMMLTSLLQIGSLMSWTTFFQKLKVTQNGHFSSKSESWCSPLCSKLAHWWVGPLFFKSWKSLKMAIFHQKVSHDAHLFAPNWLTDELDHFFSKVESHSKWPFFIKKWVMMLTSLLQIGSLMSWTTFFQKLKVTQNGHFSSKSESWCSPLCSKLAHWWVGPLFSKVESHSKWPFFIKKWVMMLTSLLQIGSLMSWTTFFQRLKVDQNGHFSSKRKSWCSPLSSKLAYWWVGPLFFKSWKSLKMTIFHQKVSHDAHLFAPNWLTDELDHFFQKLKVTQNGHFSSKSESWCSPLCSKLAHWWVGPLFFKSWKSLKMAIFHQKVSHDAHLFAPNWLTDELDHFFSKVESHSKWPFFIKKWVMMLTSLLQIGSLMSWTTFFQKLKVTQNGHFSSKSESWCSPLCSKLAHWWVGPLFFKSWKSLKMAIFHQKVSHDAHLFAPNWLTDELDHFFQKLKVTQNGHFSSKSESWCSPLCSKLAHWWVGPLFQKLKVTQNGHFSSKSESWCSPLCSKLAHWWVGPLFFKSWKSLKMAIFHQKVSHDAHLFAPNWLTDELDHFFQKLKVTQNGHFSSKSESWCSLLCSKFATGFRQLHPFGRILIDSLPNLQ